MTDRFKSRAWDAENKTMQTSFGVHNESGKPFIVTGSYFEFKNWIILYCTGIKDVNGNLIYEGDIVSCVEASGIFKVVFDDFIRGFYLIGKVNIFNLGCSIRNSLKVIGNIYENPELLQSGMEG